MKDVHALRVFAAVAQNLSFTRAAELLFMTQSGVSHQIARLERELGAVLFDRHSRGITLTPAGETLLVHARRVFALLDDAAEAVKNASQSDGGHLRIGASATACQFIIPEALREFRESFPNYTLHILPGDAPAITDELLGGGLDLGIVIRGARRGGTRQLVYHDLFRDELGFLLSPLHPWAKAGKADRRGMSQQRMVLYSRASATFRLVEQVFVRSRAELRDWIELGSMEAIKELVKLGLGVSIVARWVARAEIEEGSLVWLPLPSGKVYRDWAIAHPPGTTPSAAEQTFIGLCQSIGQAIGRR